MNPKKKPCKAIGKAKPSDISGCGKEVYDRTYGLCTDCYKDWLFTTPEGKEKQKQSLPKCGNCGERFTPFNNNSLQKFCVNHDDCIQAQVKYAQDQAVKKAERDKTKGKVDGMSTDQYRSKKIQPIINNIARLIDKGQPCIATGNTKGQMHAGHRHSVGHNRTLALNLHNIHIQTAQSNNHFGGDHVKYRAGIKRVYGVDYADYIDEYLMQCPTLNLEKEQLIELKPRLSAIQRRLEKLGIIYPEKVRIRLRDQINKEIGIYEEGFASFEEYTHNKLSSSF